MFYRVCCVMVLVGTYLRAMFASTWDILSGRAYDGQKFPSPLCGDSDMVRILTLTICKAHKNPEQHQVGSTPKTDKLFVIGSFKHARTRGNAVATTARVKLTRIPWYRDACKMTGCTGRASSNSRAVLPAKPIRFGARSPRQ